MGLSRRHTIAHVTGRPEQEGGDCSYGITSRLRPYVTPPVTQ